MPRSSIVIIIITKPALSAVFAGQLGNFTTKMVLYTSTVYWINPAQVHISLL